MANEAVKRLFSSEVQHLIFPSNTFLEGIASDAAAVDVESVEIPQDEQSRAQTVVNPTMFPLLLINEEDTKKIYNIDLIATLPQRLGWENTLLVSYDKRAAKIRKHVETLNTLIANRVLQSWGAGLTNNIIRTTGVATRPATAPGATGTRKVLVEDDILNLFTLFNKRDIPAEGRRIIVSPEHYVDIMRIKKSFSQGSEYNKELLEKGAVGMIFNFNIYMRSEVPVYDNSAIPVKKALGSLAAASDNVAILAFHKDFVRYCKGEVKTFLDIDRGDLLGSSMNFAMRTGGMITRLSEIGVVAIVESA